MSPESPRAADVVADTARAVRRLRVPEITVLFWVIKGLSTAMGESTSDYLVNAMSPVIAVLLGFVGFVVAIVIQFSMRRYVAGAYWLAVVMVGVFGTMVADVLHVGFGVPYALSTPLFAAVLAANFVAWKRVEGTLSIHSIDTARREVFYWIAVVSTFALGTALGDLSAVTLHLGLPGRFRDLCDRHYGAGDRIPRGAVQPRVRLLGRVCADAPAGSVPRRLAGQTASGWRPGDRERHRRARTHGAHHRAGGLPLHQPGRRAG